MNIIFELIEKASKAGTPSYKKFGETGGGTSLQSVRFSERLSGKL
nr:MAG TPA: hypothetical protein [Caudoviricetes sp.]